VLPRHTCTATRLWQWLLQWLAAASLKAAVEKLRRPFALESVYRFRRKLRLRLDRLRAQLCREQPSPRSAQADPLLQTTEHLRSVFARAECPAVAFQLHFPPTLIRSCFGLQRSPFDSESVTLLPHQPESFDILRVHAQPGGLCLVPGEPGTGT